MLWAGTHWGGHKLEQAPDVAGDPGPSPSSSPGPAAPLATPSIAPTAPGVPGLAAWPFDPGTWKSSLRITASAGTLGRVLPSPASPALALDQAPAPSGGAPHTPSAEFAPLLGPLERRTNF